MNNENQIGDDEILKKNQIPHNKLADLTFHEFSAYLRDLIVKNLYAFYKFKSTQDKEKLDEYKKEVESQMGNLRKVNKVYLKKIKRENLKEGETQGLLSDIDRELKVRRRIRFSWIFWLSLYFYGSILICNQFNITHLKKKLFIFAFLFPSIFSFHRALKRQDMQIERIILSHSLAKTAQIEPQFLESFIKNYLNYYDRNKLL